MALLRFKTKVKSFPEFTGMHYLLVSKTNVKKLGGKFLVRLVCTVNGKVKYQCALQGLGGGEGWIGLNKARMKALNLSLGKTVLVEVSPDKSKYGLPVPPEFRELLRQDEEGKRRFHRLSPGKQRNVLHYVGSAKTIDKRLDRAVHVIENLKGLLEGRETTAGIFGRASKFQRQS